MLRKVSPKSCLPWPIFVGLVIFWALPVGLPAVLAEAEQEEPGVDPMPPSEDNDPIPISYCPRLPGGVQDAVKAIALINTVSDPAASRGSEAWHVLRANDSIVLSPARLLEKDDSMTRLLSVAAALQATRPSGTDPTSMQAILLVRSFDRVVDSEWLSGWAAAEKAIGGSVPESIREDVAAVRVASADLP